MDNRLKAQLKAHLSYLPFCIEKVQCQGKFTVLQGDDITRELLINGQLLFDSGRVVEAKTIKIYGELSGRIAHQNLKSKECHCFLCEKERSSKK